MTSENSAARYEFKPGPFSSHGRILRAAVAWPRSHRILEIGTASGYLGRELRRLGFTDVVGVDADPESADKARGHYRQYFTIDLEVEQLPRDLGAFDVLMCADVLEHLRDPLAQLRALVRLVKPGGVLVVSLPNVANWTVRLSVLAGRFTYRERGLLDRGHLRFFTRRTARALIESAGCAIERCEATPIPLAYVLSPIVPATLARMAERAYLAPAVVWKTLFAYQFVFIARTPAKPESSAKALAERPPLA